MFEWGISLHHRTTECTAGGNLLIKGKKLLVSTPRKELLWGIANDLVDVKENNILACSSWISHN